MENKMYNVKNRSAGMLVLQIPELNIRREFAPGETQTVSYDELMKLTYQPGGKELMHSFLQIDEEITKAFNIDTQPEYFMDEDQIKELIKTGSIEAFLDALDYAPQGVIDLIKSYAVSLPMTDTTKIEAIKTKIGFDVVAAIRNSDTAPEEPAPEEKVEVAAPGERRTSVDYKAGSKYKVITKG